MTQTRIDLIRQRLEQALTPQSLEIKDQSHLHAGHAGAAAGGGHFDVQVVSSEFAGKLPLQRHRLIYRAVDDLMRPDCIHALSVKKALTPEEAAASQTPSRKDAQ